MRFNTNDILAYFKFLDNNEKAFHTVCFLDANSKTNIAGYGTVHAQVPTILANLEVLQANAPTLHACLNGTTDKGRKREHMTHARTLCVDLDSIKTKEEITAVFEEFSPHMVVLSSIGVNEEGQKGGRYHMYWKVEGLTLDAWKSWQLALAQYFGGDLNYDDITKTIRVPGVERICKDGTQFVPEIVSLTEGVKGLKVQELHELFPFWEVSYAAGLEQKKNDTKRCKAALRKYQKVGGKVDVRKGERNVTLFSVMNDRIFEDKLSLETAIGQAHEINNDFSDDCGGPMDSLEVDKIVESAHARATERLDKKVKLSKEMLEHLEVVAKTPTNGFAGIYEYDYSAGPLFEGRFTTLACVQRVFQRYGSNIVKVGGVIYAFDPDDLVWKSQKISSDVVNGFVRVCARDMIRDPAFLLAYGGDKAKGAIDKFLGHAFLSGVKTQVLESPKITKMHSYEFDSDSNLLYVKNGVLNLLSGEIRPAQPTDYLLRHSEVNYEPGAECPRWLEFIEEIFAENEEPGAMVEFIQELFGYSLTGSIAAQKLFIHYGGGSNGKSKVLQALGTIAGDYSALMAGSNLARTSNSFQKELERVGVKIEGKRVIIIDDMDTKTQWNEGLVKNLTGPTILARKLYEETRDIPNRAKFHLGCNDRPTPESENYGILRRLCIIPYRKQFDPSSTKETELQAMIKEELSGILNWALEGYIRLTERGRLLEPEEVQYSLVEYKAEHFTGETMIAELFKAPPKSCGAAEHWHAVKDLVVHVNEALEKRGMVGKRIDAERLGNILKSNLRLKWKRARTPEGRIAMYQVVVKDISNSKDSGLGLLN